MVTHHDEDSFVNHCEWFQFLVKKTPMPTSLPSVLVMADLITPYVTYSHPLSSILSIHPSSSSSLADELVKGRRRRERKGKNSNRVCPLLFIIINPAVVFVVPSLRSLDAGLIRRESCREAKATLLLSSFSSFLTPLSVCLDK